MKKIWIGIGIAVAVILVAVFIVTQTKREAGVIKIGAILPLTGPNAQWGVPPQKGAELAIEEINRKRGVKRKNFVLVAEDTRCEPKEGVSAFNKLLAQNIKIVLGGVCSSVTLAAAPIAERNKILLISPASTNPKITQAGDFIFRVIPSDALRGKVFAEYLFSKKIRNVAMLYINNEGGVGNKNAFAKRFTELGGKIVDEESYGQESTDMRTQLSKIATSKAEAVVIVSYLGDTPLIMKQAKELGLSLPLYFQTEAVEDPNVLRVAGDAAEGVIYILPAPAEGKRPNEFVQKYEKIYGKKPELFAAESYDIICLIAKAIKETGKSDPITIKDYLYTVKNYQGASGLITFDKNGDVLKPMAIKTIRKGKPVLLEVVESE